MVTSSQGRIAALAVLLLMTVAGCSTPETVPGASAHATRVLDVCLGSMPPDWSSTLSKTTVSLSPDVHFFGTMAVDPSSATAYGYYHVGSEFGVGAVSLTTGALRAIATVPTGSSGVAWMSVMDPWLAWVQNGSQQSIGGDWTIYAWNRETSETVLIASSKLPGGALLTGQLVFPVVGPGYVAWSQPISETSAEIRVFRFSSHQATTLDSGRVSSPVIAGKNLAWAKYVGDNNQPSFVMSDAATLTPGPVPAELAKPQPVTYLAGSSGYLVWTQSSSVVVADNIRTGGLSEYRLVRNDPRHSFQFPTLAGRFLVWWNGTVDTVLDLSTGYGFDVINGGAAGAGDTLVVSGANGNTPTLSRLNLAGAGIRSCSAPPSEAPTSPIPAS